MTATERERLARLEAIMERVEDKLDKIGEDLASDVADLAALKNRGTGLIVGVGLVGGGIGAGLVKFWTQLFT